MSNSLRIVSVQEPVSHVKSGQRIFLQGAAMTPNVLINSLCERYRDLNEGEMFQIHTEGNAPYTSSPYNEAFTTNTCSKIVPYLKEGAGVTTPRAHVHYIATEYGVVNLYGKNLKQRAKALISIAHPDHREQLEKEAFERLFNPA